MKRLAFPLLATLCVVIKCSVAFASPETSELLRQVRSRDLAHDPYWLALLHYPKARSLVGRPSASEIISPEFFLSADGRTDSEGELAATIEAIFKEPGSDADQHAQCRFIARYRWLRKVLDWQGRMPPTVQCKQFDAFAQHNQIESLSLIYATGYLSNPASFYGHILLKFNTPTTLTNDLLDVSVNFGAEIPHDENGVVYVIKGLFGGYAATFSHYQFYNFDHAYAENDLRDLWEYKLRLTQDEVDQIVAHSWELLGKKYVYYFLKENCAYRMAELLQLVVPDQLLPDVPWALPGVLFDRLASTQHNGGPLISEVRRIPSRQNRFRERYAALDEEGRRIAVQLVRSNLDFARTPYRSLAPASKVALVDTLLDYYEYRIVSNRQDLADKRAKQTLLAERIRLPVAEKSIGGSQTAANISPPHEGPLPTMLRMGPIHNSQFGNGILIQARPANFDHLERDAGRIPNSVLTMFDATLIGLNDRLQLRSLDFLNIENLNAARTPLPADGGMAWKVRVSIENQDLACEHCRVAKFQGGAGVASNVTTSVVAFAMIDGQVQNHFADVGTFNATPRVGFVAAPSSQWKTYLTVGRRFYLNGSRPSENVTRWENRFGSRRDWDVRLSYQQDVAREVQAAVSFYW